MFSPINYNREFEITRKSYGEKEPRSVDKMISSKKINISIMDEKLSLLNSDIEDLYKKYAEKKKIRQKKEKSEQNLVSRINFLIDEERKIRTQIENKTSKREENKIKIKSLKIFNSPEIITNTGTLRYKTIESNDDKEKSNINRYKNFCKKNRLSINSYDEKDRRNITLSSYNSSFQNNTIENLFNNNNDIKENIRINNNKNLNVPPSSNVTNNVCIIINNTEHNNDLHNSSNNYFNEDLSFKKKENNNTNINNTNDMYITTTDKEKRKIHIEIQNIKLKLASKIKSFDKDKESLSENKEENKNISINTLSLSKNKNKYKGNKNSIRSLKNILNMKKKYLKNLNNEIDLRRINNNIIIRSVENQKKQKPFNTNVNSDIGYNKDSYKKSSKEKIPTKRSYSKPDNIFNKSNNIQSINNHLDKIKSQLYNKNTLESHNKNFSIDSNEVILYDSNINISKANNHITKIKTQKSKDENNIHYKSLSIPLSNLTFQQSIENKRKMLGLGLSLKVIEENKESNDIKNIYKNNNINKLKIKYNEKKPKKIKLNSNEEEISKSEYNNEDINSIDVLSYPSISAVTNPLDNNMAKKYNFQNNFSLMSIFSNKSNKTNIPKKIIKKNYYDNNNAKITKIKNIMNNDIIIKKQEKNKNYVNSIRIIKKREKNNFKENENPINNYINININNPPVNNINTKENKNELKSKKPKLYENDITITKELAAIRRINMKIEEYKNCKPQIQKISQRRKNRFQEDKTAINDNNNVKNKYINNTDDNGYKNKENKNVNSNKGKKYRFKSYMRLSEIQAKTIDSLSKKNSIDKNKKLRSKSNKSMNKLNNNIRFLKFS